LATGTSTSSSSGPLFCDSSTVGIRTKEFADVAALARSAAQEAAEQARLACGPPSSATVAITGPEQARRISGGSFTPEELLSCLAAIERSQPGEVAFCDEATISADSASAEEDRRRHVISENVPLSPSLPVTVPDNRIDMPGDVDIPADIHNDFASGSPYTIQSSGRQTPGQRSRSSSGNNSRSSSTTSHKGHTSRSSRRKGSTSAECRSPTRSPSTLTGVSTPSPTQLTPEIRKRPTLELVLWPSLRDRGREVKVTFTKRPLGVEFAAGSEPLTVKSIDPNSSAARYGVRKGMVVSKIGGMSVTMLKYHQAIALLRQECMHLRPHS
jgi:hypothetical protein